MENLILWSSQFLQPDKIFVDIGEPYFNLIYNKCKSISTNLNTDNISFIKIFNSDVYTIIDSNKDKLKENNYPPLLFKYTEDKLLVLLSEIGYKIHKINNYVNIMLASDHCQHQNNKLTDIENVIFNKTTPGDLRNKLILSLYNFITPLPYDKKINLNVPSARNRSAMNPCIINTEDGYLCNIRYANYTYNPHFYFLDGSTTHISDHHYLYFDYNFNIKKSFILEDKTQNTYFESFVKGVDDLRLINQELFLCSHGNFNNHKTINQCLGEVKEGKINKLIPLKGPEQYRHEKNWLPFIKNNSLYIIYMIYPFTLYQVNQDTGDLILIKKLELNDLNLEGLRGSASCIRYKEGWLATCHHVVNMHYLHRFIYFNDDFTDVKISKPFYFETKGIEFNAGMCTYKDGIILSISVWDKDAKLLFINNTTLNNYINI